MIFSNNKYAALDRFQHEKIIILVILLAIGWKLYDRTHGAEEGQVARHVLSAGSVTETPTIRQLVDTSEQHFTCDGRQHYSQRASCAEVTYFLKNCPGVKLDGDHDGIPCEQQHYT